MMEESFITPDRENWVFQHINETKKRMKKKGSKLQHCTKRKFSQLEDKLLTSLVHEYEAENKRVDLRDKMWVEISSKIANRNPRQCHDRWTYYLSPDVDKTPWTEEEDNKLIDNVHNIGPRWVKISNVMPGRTDIQIKNRWNVIKRRVEANKKTEKTMSKNIFSKNQIQKMKSHVPKVINSMNVSLMNTAQSIQFTQQAQISLPAPMINQNNQNKNIFSFDNDFQEFQNFFNNDFNFKKIFDF